uniref:Ig-like domain-containing protein n=1 Tax=Chrysemys picta bellii TaxID=8478 RepID=A0A8C3PD67_CHRPI
PSILPSTLLARALAQLRLVASGPGVGKSSESLSLTCAVSGESITTSGFRGHWYRQVPGKGPEWLGLIYWDGDTRYAPSLQGRITISADTAKNQFSLQLPTDTATYYCAWRDTVTRRQGAWDKKGASHTLHLPERRHLTSPLRSAPSRCHLKETLCQRPPGRGREGEKEEAPALVNGQERDFVTGVGQFWKPQSRPEVATDSPVC